MRYLAIALSFCFLTSAAMAQTIDWKTLGRPLDDDTKSMMDRYVYTNADSIDRTIGLDNPVLSQTQITQWITDNLGQILSLKGDGLDEQIVTNRTKFTPSGYGQYILYLNKSNLANFLKGNHFKTNAYVEGQVDITAQGLREITKPEQDGSPPAYAYVWQAKAHVVISYLDYRNQPPAMVVKPAGQPENNNRFPAVVTLELIRIPVQDNDTLVAINSITFNDAK